MTSMGAATIPEWLTEEAIAQTEALGREMAIFLQRRSKAKRADPDAEVEPQPRLIELIAAATQDCRLPGQADSTDRQ